MKFSGLAPLAPGASTIDLEVSGLGLIDLRNDYDLVQCVVKLTKTRSTICIRLESRPDASTLIDLNFLDVELIEAEIQRLDDILIEDRTLFEDLMFWQNENGSGFAVETGVAHFVFKATELTVEVRSQD